YQSLSVTIWYSIGTVPVQLAVSMILAYLLFQNIKGKGIFRIVFFIPYIAPAVATAGIFQAMFSLRPSSIANSLIGATTPETALRWIREPGPAIASFGQLLGIESAVNWEFGPSLALTVVILYNIWVFVGYDTVIFLAGLGNIPFSLYEAARIDGASQWQLFRHITFPLLSPTTYFLSVISIIGTFKAFNHIFVLRTPEAQGTMDAASVHFFTTFQSASRFGYATSMAIMLFIIILILYLIQNRIAARSVHYG
ncbi:MAG: sugar ABC transporter permease, partial [Chloroflexi bacterium]|nr:sugar ABC transporter permease [Chloroflexota bacterium]